MERPERPSRHSKSHDKWKRIIEPAGDSDSSSDWSTDSDAASAPPRSSRPPYFSQPTDAPTTSTAHTQSTSSPAQIATERRDRLMSILPHYSSLIARYGANNKRSLDPGESSSSSHNYHLLHHDYAERDSFRTLSGDDCSWFLRPSSVGVAERKRPRLSARLPPPTNTAPSDYPGEAAQDVGGREDADATSASLLYPLSTSNNNNNNNNNSSNNNNNSSRSPGAASAGGGGDAGVEGVGEAAADAEAALLPSSAAAMRRCLSEHRYTSDHLFDWDPPHLSNHRMHNPFMKMTKRTFMANSSVLPGERTAQNAGRVEDPSEIQVILMAGPSTSASSAASLQKRKPLVDRLNALVAAATEEVIIVDDHQVTEVQSDPPVETGSVEELPPAAAAGVELKPRPSADEETLNQGLIGLLECPVCMEYMAPPIHQCRRGHLVCVNCKPKLPLCPTCRSRLTDSRNLAMEKVADKLLYPCKNAHVSCAAQLRLKDKGEHEANCDHRAYRCSLPLCEWKGFKDELLAHNSAKHADRLLFGNKHVLSLRLGDLSTPLNQNWIVSTLDELFRVNLISVRSGQRQFETGLCRTQLFGCVQYVGPQNRAAGYEYTLEARSQTTAEHGRRCITFTRDCHRDLVKCADNYSAGDSFYLRGDTAELMSDGPHGDAVLAVHLAIQANRKERGQGEAQ